MNTNIFTVPDIKNLFIEALLNKTDKVSKISNHSVVNGMAYGVAKICQKEMKDSALVESQLFPEWASGDELDLILKREGLVPRAASSGSSVWVRVWGQPNTGYTAGINKFYSTSGIEFDVEEDFNIGDTGIGYIKLRSVDIGVATNVEANTINRVLPQPQGHEYVINEVEAIGGSEVESDAAVLQRIQENYNRLAADTLTKIKIIATQINPLVLDIRKGGFDSENNILLLIVTRNGSDLSLEELEDLQLKIDNYLSLSLQNISNDLNDVSSKISFQNISYEYIDIEFRVEFKESVLDIETVRKQIQTSLMKYLDFTTWDKEKVEWEDLYYIIRNVEEIKFIPEQYFTPHVDISVTQNKLPRLRGFVMSDITGNIILNESNTILPVYYSDSFTDSINLNLE